MSEYDREELEQRVDDLEHEVQELRGQVRRQSCVRYTSSVKVAGIPLVSIAQGPDPENGEIRGHAKGIVAIGDIATGVFALGGLANGVFAIGGLAIGVVSLGGMSIGILAALGGLAVGGFAVGGVAIGLKAIGGAPFNFN